MESLESLIEPSLSSDSASDSLLISLEDSFQDKNLPVDESELQNCIIRYKKQSRFKKEQTEDFCDDFDGELDVFYDLFRDKIFLNPFNGSDFRNNLGKRKSPFQTEQNEKGKKKKENEELPKQKTKKAKTENRLMAVPKRKHQSKWIDDIFSQISKKNRRLLMLWKKEFQILLDCFRDQFVIMIRTLYWKFMQVYFNSNLDFNKNLRNFIVFLKHNLIKRKFRRVAPIMAQECCSCYCPTQSQDIEIET